MSDSERTDVQAFRDLEVLVHNLAEELATFRRRALLAEARLRELEPESENGGSRQMAPSRRIVELEQENESLRELLEGARTRTRGILDRVHFLRQQAQGGGT